MPIETNWLTECGVPTPDVGPPGFITSLGPINMSSALCRLVVTRTCYPEVCEKLASHMEDPAKVDCLPVDTFKQYGHRFLWQTKWRALEPTDYKKSSMLTIIYE